MQEKYEIELSGKAKELKEFFTGRLIGWAIYNE